MTSTPASIFDFLHTAEKLKMEMRHSWLSDGRRESVAEHTWRMTLMVMTLAPHLSQKVNIQDCLEMAILHDLPEAKVGDIPAFDIKTPEMRAAKVQAETLAMDEICTALGGEGGRFYALWLRYEDRQCYESKFVNAIDKLEVHLQHIEADIATWSDFEKVMWLQDKWMLNHCAFDPYLKGLALEIQARAVQIMEESGEDLGELARLAQVA